MNEVLSECVLLHSFWPYFLKNFCYKLKFKLNHFSKLVLISKGSIQRDFLRMCLQQKKKLMFHSIDLCGVTSLYQFRCLKLVETYFRLYLVFVLSRERILRPKFRSLWSSGSIGALWYRPLNCLTAKKIKLLGSYLAEAYLFVLFFYFKFTQELQIC